MSTAQPPMSANLFSNLTNPRHSEVDEFDTDDPIPVILFQKVLPFFLLVFGTAGNILTLMALHRNKHLKSVYKVYHTVLACCDLFVIYVCLVRFWFLALVHFDLRHGYYVLCKAQTWLEHSCLLAPSWVLIAMTMQVQEGLGKPHALGTNLTRIKAFLYCGSAVFLALVYNLHALFGFGDMSKTAENGENMQHNNAGFTVGDLRNAENYVKGNSTLSNSPRRHQYCVPTPGAYAKFVTYAWPWIDTCAIFLFPAVVMAAGLVLIIRFLISNSKTPPATDNNGTIMMTSSVLTLDVMFVMMSGPYCIFSMANAVIYANGGDNLAAEKRIAYSVICALFYTMFAFRWVATCTCGKLWPYVIAKFRSCKSCRPKT